MPRHRDIATLLEIEQAAQKILRYKRGLDKAAFMEDLIQEYDDLN